MGFAQFHSVLCTVCHTEHVLGEDAQVILVRTLLVAQWMVVQVKMVGIVLGGEPSAVIAFVMHDLLALLSLRASQRAIFLPVR
jgi:hypothetical protein